MNPRTRRGKRNKESTASATPAQTQPDAVPGAHAKRNRKPREPDDSIVTTENTIAAAVVDVTPKPLFIASIAVRWRDLDAFNHVNNSSFLTYLEEARLQWLKQVPGPWFHAHSMPVVAASELNYRAPIAWPARVAVELICERIGTSSLTLAHRIVDADDDARLYCDGRIVLVWTDPATGKPVALPEAIRVCA